MGQAAGAITAGTDLTGAGSIAFGTQAGLTASHDVTLTGKLVGGQLQVTGQQCDACECRIDRCLALRLTGRPGGDIAMNGNGSTIGATSVAARDIAFNGPLQAPPPCS